MQSEFDFDAAGGRARQVKERIAPNDAREIETTLYLGAYERENHTIRPNELASAVLVKTVHRHSLGGGMIYTRTLGGSEPGTKLTNVLKDHLGSTDALVVGIWNGSTFANQSIERLSFDAWGERRDASTQISYRTSDSDPFRTSAKDHDRGYTGHEQLDDSGLIHMNGRIYDPELRRFLSPDPVVQIPEYSQNFNRYSYVLNNPLNATDPSGFSFVSKAFSKIGSFIKENWRTIVVIVVAVAAWYFAPAILGAFGAPAAITATGSAATIGGAAAQGAVAGFISGGFNAAINGGDVGDVLRGAVVGGASGALFGAASGTSGWGGIAARGLIGGARNVAMGGKFQDGFISAAATAAAAPTPVNSNDGLIQAASKAAVAGVIGGTASSLGGGRFSNGAWTSSFQFLISPTTSRVGAFSGIANGLEGMRNANSLGQFGIASLKLLGLPSDLFQKWVPSSSGGKVPGSAASVISDAATSERMYNKGFENVNGHHGWHAGTNALAAYRYGLGLGSILQVSLGIAHETIDFADNAIPAEYKNQGPYNMVFDSVTDIVSNTYGMFVGFLSSSDTSAAQFSITTGNWIPGPTDSDPNFNGDGSTYIQRGRNPVKAWGQNPANKNFW